MILPERLTVLLATIAAVSLLRLHHTHAFTKPPSRLAKHSVRTRGSAQMATTTSNTDERIVVCGGGVIGASILYHLTQRGYKPVMIERSSIAAAASGKSGGFLARAWGDRSVTEGLHHVSFDLHKELAAELNVESYRGIPTLSVQGGRKGGAKGTGPKWLDRQAKYQLMDPDTAQVTPRELTEKMVAAAVAKGATVTIGAVEGLVCEDGPSGSRVTGVRVEGHAEPVACDRVVLAMGPWTTVASDWLKCPLPMSGIYSTSIVLPDCTPATEEPYALFCGEDSNGCHLEVYPRPNGEVYICGLGGSDHVDESRLKLGGDCDRPEKIEANTRRVSAALRSFGAMSSMADGKEASSQACMRPCPPDSLPYIGQVPTTTNAYVAAGHNCWGILWAPVTGLLISELIADGRASSVDIRQFSPGRFLDKKGRRGRKMKGQEVGEQW